MAAVAQRVGRPLNDVGFCLPSLLHNNRFDNSLQIVHRVTRELQVKKLNLCLEGDVVLGGTTIRNYCLPVSPIFFELLLRLGRVYFSFGRNYFHCRSLECCRSAGMRWSSSPISQNYRRNVKSSTKCQFSIYSLTIMHALSGRIASREAWQSRVRFKASLIRVSENRYFNIKIFRQVRSTGNRLFISLTLSRI